MQTPFPVTHSVVSAQALEEYILSHYEIGSLANCVLHTRGINDTYEITTQSGQRFFLRVYRTPWRSFANVGYEVDALRHLHQKGIPVAYPIAQCSGSFIGTVNAPEGNRAVVLFNLAPGKEPSYTEDPGQKAFDYGRAVARLHNALQDFASPHQRFQLDLDHLIDAPLKTIQPVLARRPSDWQYLLDFANLLHQRITALPASALEWGFCHGDLQGYHHHIQEDGTLTFFDFDCCGYGIRAYDLAVFHWCFHQEANEKLVVEQYRQGYQDERPLNEVDLRAIPLFVAARYIWHMGLHTANGADWGFGWLNDAYFDKAMKNLRACEM
jgi:Ser/Thr protein kinase RdoA (MazF antagonist)